MANSSPPDTNVVTPNGKNATAAPHDHEKNCRRKIQEYDKAVDECQKLTGNYEEGKKVVRKLQNFKDSRETLQELDRKEIDVMKQSATAKSNYRAKKKSLSDALKKVQKLHRKEIDVKKQSATAKSNYRAKRKRLFDASKKLDKVKKSKLEKEQRRKQARTTLVEVDCELKKKIEVLVGSLDVCCTNHIILTSKLYEDPDYPKKFADVKSKLTEFLEETKIVRQEDTIQVQNESCPDSFPLAFENAKKFTKLKLNNNEIGNLTDRNIGTYKKFAVISLIIAILYEEDETKRNLLRCSFIGNDDLCPRLDESMNPKSISYLTDKLGKLNIVAEEVDVDCISLGQDDYIFCFTVNNVLEECVFYRAKEYYSSKGTSAEATDFLFCETSYMDGTDHSTFVDAMGRIFSFREESTLKKVFRVFKQNDENGIGRSEDDTDNSEDHH